MFGSNYEVHIYSAFGVHRPLYYADSYEEAWDFCETHDWCWVDDNEFEWSLDIVDRG